MPEVSEKAGQRQRIFLVGAATAVAAHGDGEFAARQDRHALALRARLQRELRVIGSHGSGLAFKVGAEIDDGVAGVAGHPDRGVERSLRPRDQFELRTGESRIAGLAALVAGLVERAADGVVEL